MTIQRETDHGTPARESAQTVSLTIDGVSVTVPQGTSLMRAAIDAGAGGVMVALNSINGIPATANTWLMNDLLRKDWGFKGLTVSDHGAIVELIKHGVAKDGRKMEQPYRHLDYHFGLKASADGVASSGPRATIRLPA